MSADGEETAAYAGFGATAAAGIRVFSERGDFSDPTRVTWAGGLFTLGSEPEAADIDGRSLYLVPGLVDAHAHVAWHAFNESDRLKETPAEQDRATLEVLRTMLRAGFTSVRDAGGLTPSLTARAQRERGNRAGSQAQAESQVPAAAHLLPRTQTSVTLIDRARADAAGGVLAATEEVLTQGARWVKLVGTASVASPPGAGLDPVFTAAEQRAVVERAAEVGAGVMLHAWGGPAIDHAIEAGVMSIEHGIFLTPEQATRAAEHGMTLVPTLKIYKLVHDMIRSGALPASFEPRVREAVHAHPGSVRIARDAGLAIALGSDFSTPEQHGTNRTEFDELVRAGLTPSEALTAATRSGAELLARVAHDPQGAPSGLIADGEIADAVIFDRNPLEPGAFSAPESVVAVIIDGTLIDLTETNTLRKDTP